MELNLALLRFMSKFMKNVPTNPPRSPLHYITSDKKKHEICTFNKNEIFAEYLPSSTYILPTILCHY